MTSDAARVAWAAARAAEHAALAVVLDAGLAAYEAEAARGEVLAAEWYADGVL